MTTEQEARPPRPAGRIAAWVARQVERGLAESELSLPQYRVLGLLAEGNALPSSLADRLDVRRPSITAVVDGLVARGLVTRTPAEDDRRQVSHAITEEGRLLLQRADEDVTCRLTDIASCLDSEAERRVALASLEIWDTALRKWKEREAARQAEVSAEAAVAEVAARGVAATAAAEVAEQAKVAAVEAAPAAAKAGVN